MSPLSTITSLEMSYSATLPPTEDIVKLQTICFWIHAFEHLWMKLPLFNWTQILSVLQQADNPLIRGDTLKEEVNTNPIAILDGRSIHLRQREPTPRVGEKEQTSQQIDYTSFSFPNSSSIPSLSENTYTIISTNSRNTTAFNSPMGILWFATPATR